MQKNSFLFLLVMLGLSLLTISASFQQVSAHVAFARLLGQQAFFLLCVSLMIGPIVALKPEYAQLIEPRRAIGIAAFFLMASHGLFIFYKLYGGSPEHLFGQFSVQLGALAAFLASALALTSSDYAVKSLGERLWKGIQRLNYLVFILAFAHFLYYAELDYAKPALEILGRLAMVLLGAITAILQIFGFWAKIKRTKAAAK